MKLSPAQRHLLLTAGKTSHDDGATWRGYLSCGPGRNVRTAKSLLELGLLQSIETAGPPSNRTQVWTAELSDEGEKVLAELRSA